MSEEKSGADKKEEKKKKKGKPSEDNAVADRGFFRMKTSEGDKPVPLWLITFTDVMALMLTFFVLLYSMSVPKEEEWSHMTAALNMEFNKFYNSKWDRATQDSINIEKLDFSSALDLDYLTALVQQLIENEGGLTNVVLIPQKDRLIVSLPSDLLFDVGKADVKDEGSKALFSLGGALSRIKNRIEVIGHSDPRPIQAESGEFASNWELSLARGLRVAGILENVGYRRSITVRGLSSARYDELRGEMAEEERLDLARRVDIVIMKDSGSRRRLLDMGL